MSEAAGPLEDAVAPRPVTHSETVFTGAVWDVLRETVDLGDAGVVRREKVAHTGAVAVLALDDDDRVLLVHQYRHPVRSTLWELPAGLLDVAGEDPLVAAQRELAEEADARAGRWDLLVDLWNSPGGSDEFLRIYLARDVTEVPEGERHTREHEEADMTSRWVPLDEARDAVLAGRVRNPGAVAGVLAAWASRAGGWSSLRDAHEPLPRRG